MWARRLQIISLSRWDQARARCEIGGLGILKGKLMSGFLRGAVLVAVAAAVSAGNANGQTSYDLRSPNNRIELRIRTANGIRYDVLLGGRAILQDCTLSIDVDHRELGAEAKVLRHKESSQDRILEPVVRQKFAKIRAYNEGVAYRLEASLPQQEVKVYGEEMNLNFPSNYVVYYPEEESFFSHNERKYLPRHLSARSEE